MFKKLFKYDFKAIKRVALPVSLITLAVSIIGSLDLVLLMNSFKRSLEGTEDSGFFALLSAVGMIGLYGVFFIIALGPVVIQVITLVDYYKTTATDEAYLTFTLPVKPVQLILSKLLSSMLWIAVGTVAALLSVGIIAIVGIITGSVMIDPAAWQEFTAEFEMIFEPMLDQLFTGGSLAGMIIIAIISVIVTAFNSQLLYFMAIFIGSTITRKNKAIAAIGCILAVNLVYGMINGIITAIISFIATGSGALSGSPAVAMNLNTGLTTFFSAAFAVAFFFVLKHMMEKRLNLD